MPTNNNAENAGSASAAATNPTLNLTPAAGQGAPDLQVSLAASTPAASPELGASPTRTGQDLLDQLEREAKVYGCSPEGIQQKLSQSAELLQQAGYKLDQPLDARFLDRLHQLSPQDGCGTKPSSVNALERAYKALTGTRFPALIRSCLAAAKMTCKALACVVGITVELFRFGRKDQYGGITGMTPDQALTIDQALAANGIVVAAYCALSQDAAYIRLPSIIDEILGRQSFGALLMDLRHRTKLTQRALLEQLEQQHHIRLSGRLLNCWEEDYFLPAQSQRNVVTALDALYQAKGKLLAAWEQRDPRQIGEISALPFRMWPLRAQNQFRRLVDCRTANSEKLPRPARTNQWTGPNTEAAFRLFCERFFGFLVLEKQLEPENVSLTLLGDWKLVHACFDWGKQKVGRKQYNVVESWRTGTLCGLYRSFFPHLADDAAQEDYWQQLPKSATKAVTIKPGVIRRVVVPLLNWTERWNHHLALTRAQAVNFLKQNTFIRTPYLSRAQPLFEAGVGLNKIIDRLAARARLLPPRILSRRAAIQCRRLAEAALLLCWYLRPNMFLLIKCGQVVIVDGLKIRLTLPEDQFRNRGMAGSKDGLSGLLPNWPCVHLLLRRYLEEARPILLGDPNLRGNQDAGYLFIDAFTMRRGLLQKSLMAGGPIQEKSFYYDIVLTLGCNPWAVRYLFAVHAWNHGATTDQIAQATQTTAAAAAITFEKVEGAHKTQQAIDTVSNVLFPKKRNKK